MLKISSLISRKKVGYGKTEKSTRDWTKSMIGQKYWITDTEQRYIGLCRYPTASCFSESVGDLVRWKGEFLRFKEGKSYSIQGDEGEYLIPIASDVPNIYSFKEASQQYVLKQYGIKQFEYYRVKRGTSIISKDTAYFGEPIPLYIWMTICDLHDVADQMVLPISVQKDLSLKERAIVTGGSTSVKQAYDENKIIAYKKMCTYIDFVLNSLYS